VPYWLISHKNNWPLAWGIRTPDRFTDEVRVWTPFPTHIQGSLIYFYKFHEPRIELNLSTVLRFLHQPLTLRRNHVVTLHTMFIHGRWQHSVSENHITSTYKTVGGGTRLPWISCACVYSVGSQKTAESNWTLTKAWAFSSLVTKSVAVTVGTVRSCVICNYR